MTHFQAIRCVDAAAPRAWCRALGTFAILAFCQYNLLYAHRVRCRQERQEHRRARPVFYRGHRIRLRYRARLRRRPQGLSRSPVRAIGFLRRRLHVLCFTPIDAGIRVISFRKANNREIKAYEQAHAHD